MLLHCARTVAHRQRTQGDINFGQRDGWIAGKGHRAVMLSQPNLLDSTSRADFAARIGAAARERPGKWILGGSWDEQRLGGELPTREWIDAVTSDTPVAVPRTDLHSYLLNSVALRLAGITRNTPDPAGGLIVRDARGEPTGIVKDNAKDLVDQIVPPPSDADTDEHMRFGIAHGLSKGVAQAHNPEPFDWNTYFALRRLRQKGALIASGATVTFGSDWPVAPLDPLTGVYAAVTRRTIDGANPNGWLPNQKTTVEQALICYTRNNAYAGFMEDRTGQIATGYLADITVLDADLLSIDPLKIPAAKVLRTFVGGTQRFGEGVQPNTTCPGQRDALAPARSGRAPRCPISATLRCRSPQDCQHLPD